MTAITAPPPVGPAVQRRRIRWTPAVLVVVVLAMCGLTVGPLVYLTLGGFRSTAQMANAPVALPSPWVLENYRDVLVSPTFWHEVFNSAFIAVVATTLVVVVSALAAFPLSRYEFAGRELVYGLFTLGLLFPIGVAILPLYLMLRELYLLDSPWAVALPEAAFGIPMTIVILRPFMRSIPGELEDAAALDGCSGFAFFWRILLPLSKPALTTVAVLAFIGSWNAFLLPLLVLNSESQFTLPLGTANYSTEYTQDTARIFAFTALSLVPAVVFFVLAERRIVSGLSGAVKG